MFFQFFEAKNETGDSRQPDESKNSPSPSAGMPQNKQGKRSVGSGNVQIDSSMIEFTEQLFQLSRTTAVIPRRTDIPNQIGSASCRDRV